MIPQCPVFTPSLQEFADFERYIATIRQQEPTAAMVRITAPAGWTPRADNYQGLELVITHPVRQEIYGQTGKYQMALVSQRKLPLSKYRAKAVLSDTMTEGKTDEKVESLFWKSISFNSPIYGSDTDSESLFDPGVPWNLSELPSILKVGLGGHRLPGIVTPYLYIGAWKTVFAWHNEDLNLPAINYLHYGKPKLWYAIDFADTAKFEAFARNCFPDAAAACPEFLRHKSSLISPYILLQHGIHITKTIQKSRDFVVVFEGVYHSGFNYGYNAAESVNFAMENWVEIGKKVGYCRCEKGSVRIDWKTFEANLQSAKRKRESEDEETPTKRHHSK